MSNRMKALYSEVVFERRILLACMVLLGLSIIAWTVAMGTNYWLVASSPEDKLILMGEVGMHNGTKVFLGGQSGLFRSCNWGYTQIFRSNGTTERHPFKDCNKHDLFPPEMKQKSERRADEDATLINYHRADVSFAIISMFIMLMGFGFSVYTFRNPRYTFKRLAGGIHFITCACVMMVIQVKLALAEYGGKKEHWLFPRGSDVTYGFSFWLAWIVFSCNLLVGFCFMIFSRKRKRDRAPNDEMSMADEPTIIGR
ncbi:hypothetical protein QAD02_017559 [Eretmocerus hayati]|uniref:Uncharacterized protein n=1 Tax=Eretmocerus hayati TaxID=131215 RepID=A0ACC2PE94_9HYME|nr:hypothetical protein QAD02_017559 [Eretmocerus hayati]